MSLCLPVIAIEPMLDKVGAEYTFYGARPQRKDVRTTEILGEIMMSAAAKVEAIMTGSAITVEDLLKLQVGDIIRLSNSVADENCVTVSVCGRPKFAARQGRIGSKQAVQIAERII